MTITTPLAPLPVLSMPFDGEPSCWQMNGFHTMAATIPAEQWDEFTAAVASLFAAEYTKHHDPSVTPDGVSFEDHVLAHYTGWVNLQLTDYKGYNLTASPDTVDTTDRFELLVLSAEIEEAEEHHNEPAVDRLTDAKVDLISTTPDRSIIIEQWVGFESELYLAAALNRPDVSDADVEAARVFLADSDELSWDDFVADFLHRP